jgi:hypothetical protein
MNAWAWTRLNRFLLGVPVGLPSLTVPRAGAARS